MHVRVGVGVCACARSTVSTARNPLSSFAHGPWSLPLLGVCVCWGWGVVSRIVCGKSENYEFELTVDLNTDIYPVEIGSRLSVAFAHTLNRDGTPDSEFYDPTVKESTLADDYEYVMHGRVYKYADDKGPVPRVAILISFGGLLLELKGEPHHVQGLELDSKVYLLIRQA